MDPDALYGTVIQSSVSVVAIVGGFITAALLQSSAERNSLEARTVESRSVAEALMRQAEAARGAVGRRQAHFAISDNLDALLDALERDPAMDGRTAQKMGAANHVSADDFGTVWRSTVAACLKTRAQLEADIEQVGLTEDDHSLVRWAENHGVDLTSYDSGLAWALFPRISAAKLSELRPEQVPTGIGALLGFTLDVSDLGRIESAETARSREERGRDRRQEVDELNRAAWEIERQAEVAVAETEHHEQRLWHFRPPSYVAMGLLALLAFTVAGVVVPLFAWPQNSAEFEQWLVSVQVGGTVYFVDRRYLATDGLLSGLGLTFVYITYVARKLYEESRDLRAIGPPSEVYRHKDARSSKPK